MSGPTLGADLMTGAELKVVREWLGLTTRWLAEHLDVAERTVHRWEMGVQPVPDGVRLAVERLEACTAGVVAEAVRECEDTPDPAAVAMVTYRTDADYRDHHPDQVWWPAAWHRRIVARVAQEIPGLPVSYWGGRRPA